MKLFIENINKQVNAIKTSSLRDYKRHNSCFSFLLMFHFFFHPFFCSIFAFIVVLSNHTLPLPLPGPPWSPGPSLKVRLYTPDDGPAYCKRCKRQSWKQNLTFLCQLVFYRTTCKAIWDKSGRLRRDRVNLFLSTRSTQKQEPSREMWLWNRSQAP